MPTLTKEKNTIASGGALSRIRGILPSLLPAEKKVGIYLLKNSDEIMAQSVGEVARGADVSEATVIRFCRSAGFVGFADLKIGLARETVSPLASTLHEDISAKDDPATLARKIFGANIDTLKETLGIIDPKAVDKAAGWIANSETVMIIGVGTSAPVAFDAYVKLLRLGLPVVLFNDSHLMMMRAALLKKGDTIIAISHSGMTKDPVDAVAVGKKAGANCVAITNNRLSPLSKGSDLVLLTASKETKFRSEALSSRIAQSAIIDLLYVSAGLKESRRTVSSAKKIEDVITAKQY